MDVFRERSHASHVRLPEAGVAVLPKERYRFASVVEALNCSITLAPSPPVVFCFFVYAI